MEALGRLFDISAGVVNVDFNTAGATGKRVYLKNATGLTVVVLLGAAASGTEDVVLTLQQHTVSSSGTPANLAVCDHYYIKAAATLAGTETWTRVVNNSGTPSQTVTIPGATYAASQAIAAIEINASSLADGFKYVSVNVGDPGAVSRTGSVLYFLHDLTVRRKPANLAAALA